MQVVNCTTPANFFHVLRRQIHSEWRKPLIVMTPKSLLRHKLAVSTLADMSEGTAFEQVVSDKIVKSATRVVLCSGKVYYDLLEARELKQNQNVAIVRIEEYYPFPDAKLANALKAYGDVPLVWCQEEPQNMGAWQFLDRRLEGVLKSLSFKHNRPYYVGRPEAASPATGIAGRHIKEQAQIVENALFGPLQES
jgi:2-oxoglutarate dehydrogenase E1 component